jgi:hypothetical protein
VTAEAAIIGLAVGLLVAALVVLGLHWRTRRGARAGAAQRPTGGQGAGIAADPGQSRPAGPDAEAQTADRSGGVGARDDGATSERDA